MSNNNNNNLVDDAEKVLGEAEKLIEEESTLEIYHNDNAPLWEINTMIVRAEQKDELDAGLNYLKNKYGSSIITLTNIPKRQDKTYYYTIVTYKTPLIAKDD